MLLSELKEYLTYGELSQLAIGDFSNNENTFKQVISAINLGIIELYKRFPIKLKETTINLLDATYVYALPADLVKVDAVYNSLEEEIPVNDYNDELSVFIINYDELKHPYPVAGDYITVEYRAAITKLSLAATDATDIEIPSQFIEALVNYVAYRMFAAINMNSAEAVNYYAKFEASCALINNFGLWDKSANTNLKLGNAGWL